MNTRSSAKRQPLPDHSSRERRSSPSRLDLAGGLDWRWVALLCSLVFVVPVAIWVGCLVGGEPLANVRLQGELIPEGTPLDGYLRARAERWAAQSVVLQTGVHVWSTTRGEIGAALPVEPAREAVLSIGRSANPFVALQAWWESKFGAGHDVVWRPTIDSAQLERMLEAIRANIDRPPTVGSFDPAGKQIPGLDGEALDIESTKAALRSAMGRHALQLEVATIVTPPPRSFRRYAPAAHDVTAETGVLMMRQESEYRPRNEGRATNIELAARKLDGVVIMPGDELSFNRVVGKREARRGFAPALELMNGELALGIGGGVCQVAGTVHAAAFFAGLIVDEYRPHSRLSQLAYLRPGLDTMVAWPDHVTDLRDTKDMRVRNPYPFPITIRTSIINGQSALATLRVELYGAARAFRVDWGFEEVDHVPANEIVRYDSSLPRGRQRVQQEGLPGLVIMRRRTIYTPTRRVQEETRVAYPPTPRILLIGSG